MTAPPARPSLGEQFPTLLVAAQEGGDWAVAALYRWLQPAVMGYLRARAGAADAEDLAAETWLDVARSLRSFSGTEAGFRSFVFTIAHRRLVDHLRDSARRPRARSLSPTDDTDGPGPMEVAAPDDPAAEVLAALAAGDAVRRIVALLPADQAEVVLLRVVAGLPVEDVARATGRRPGTVRVLQHRALRRLAERLGPTPASSGPAKNPDLPAREL